MRSSCGSRLTDQDTVGCFLSLSHEGGRGAKLHLLSTGVAIEHYIKGTASTCRTKQLSVYFSLFSSVFCNSSYEEKCGLHQTFLQLVRISGLFFRYYEEKKNKLQWFILQLLSVQVHINLEGLENCRLIDSSTHGQDIFVTFVNA